MSLNVFLQSGNNPVNIILCNANGKNYELLIREMSDNIGFSVIIDD